MKSRKSTDLSDPSLNLFNSQLPQLLPQVSYALCANTILVLLAWTLKPSWLVWYFSYLQFLVWKKH